MADEDLVLLRAGPEEGGYTPIADSREVYRRIPACIRERFNRNQIMYVRNYGNGLDVPWQKVFNTEDPAVVEAFCRINGILYEWKADGELRTRQVAQAIAVHPLTGRNGLVQSGASVSCLESGTGGA
jgi:hypothetical protein